MKKLAYSLSAALLALTIMPWQASTVHAADAVATTTPLATEVTVQTEANFKNADDVSSFVIQAARNHVSVINMSVKQDSDVDGSSGYAFYDSKIAPEAEGYTEFDALAAMIEKAHEYGIKVQAWVPQFQDKAAIGVNSSWQMRTVDDKGNISTYTGKNGSSYYVNPFDTDVQTYERSIVKEVVTNYNVDGVVLSGLDFDTNRVDMNTTTINQFRSTNNVDPKKIDFTKSSSNSKIAQWTQWKSDQLANYIKEVSTDIKTIKPDLTVGVYSNVSNTDGTTPNVAAYSSSVNFITPVADYQQLGRNIDWVYSKDGVISQAQAGDTADTKQTIVPALSAGLTNDASIQIYNGLHSTQSSITTVNYVATGEFTEAMLNNIGTRLNY